MNIDGNPEQGRHAELRRPPGHVLASAIVSGDSEQDDDESSSEDEEFGDEDIFEDAGGYSAEAADGEALFRVNPGDPAQIDELYDQNLDDEDEAYVYKHMRGGIQESIMVRTANNTVGTSSSQPLDTNPEDSSTPSRPRKVLKPRNSDAVLSCPCCFNIVCMDCQRHQKYLHQFRAMFVMGIAVDWQSRLIYDEDQQILVPKPRHLPHQVPPENAPTLNDFGEVGDEGIQYKEGEYFPVLCGNCQTQVAALDMVEEVYHFHGCLESS